MSARIVTGHALRRDLVTQAAKHASDAGVIPVVALIMVDNEDPMTPLDFRLHHKVFTGAGFDVRPFELARDTTPGQIQQLIGRLNQDDEIDVVQVLIPLPPQLDIRSVLAAIDPVKEAEGLHLEHVIRLNPLSDRPPTRIPVVPTAVAHVLNELDFDPSGGQVVVLTDPDITETNPVAKMVARVAAFAALPPDTAGTSVPVTHPRAAEITSTADLLVVSVQRPEIVTADWVKPGATVIDFIRTFLGWRASEKDPAGRVAHLVGGVHHESVAEVAATIVPAIGGAGPVMIGALVDQIVTATIDRRSR
ncbi:tetrahydrofolate dehydrogenase/cyclohydrolase catalytic domain-containing protein [Crossiella sp. NPDC003009]